jgi:hypothetical protein
MRKPRWVRSPVWLILLLVGPANAQEAPAAAGADPSSGRVSCETFALPEGPVPAVPGAETACQWEGPGSTRVEARVGTVEAATSLTAPEADAAHGTPARDAGLALGFSVGSVDSRVRLDTRYGLSRRRPQPDADRPLGGPAAPGRLPETGAELAHAILGHIDLDLWRGERFRVTAFGSYRRTDSLFAGLGGTGNQEGFGTPDRSTLEGGLRLSAGWVSLKLARELSQMGLSGRGAADVSRTERIRADLGFDLGGMGRLTPPGLAWLTPSAVWLRVAGGRSRRERPVVGRAEAVADLAGGATWSGNGYQATLSLWRSVSGTFRPFGDSADWSGNGARIDWSLIGELWTLSGVAGYRRDTSLTGESGRLARRFHGSLALGLEAFPCSRLSARVSFGDAEPASPALHASRPAFSIGAAVDLATPCPRGNSCPRLHAAYTLGLAADPGDLQGTAHTVSAALELDF